MSRPSPRFPPPDTVRRAVRRASRRAGPRVASPHPMPLATPDAAHARPDDSTNPARSDRPSGDGASGDGASRRRDVRRAAGRRGRPVDRRPAPHHADRHRAERGAPRPALDARLAGPRAARRHARLKVFRRLALRLARGRARGAAVVYRDLPAREPPRADGPPAQGVVQHGRRGPVGPREGRGPAAEALRPAQLGRRGGAAPGVVVLGRQVGPAAGALERVPASSTASAPPPVRRSRSRTSCSRARRSRSRTSSSPS